VIAARRLDRLEALAHQLRTDFSIGVDCVRIDLSEPGSSKALFDAATSDHKSVTLLINNAGVGKYGEFIGYPYENHYSTLFLNTISPTELTYLFVRHMLAHGRESFITQVASIAAFQPVGNFSVYSGTKGYIMYFSETLAFELRKTNVKVMCLCPGGTYTEFFEHSGQKITGSGHKTMMTAQAVVRPAIRAMLRGKTLFIPGFINKLACFAPRLLPRTIALHLAYQAMSRAVEKP
jgi:short-subunit dehydrogenase